MSGCLLGLFDTEENEEMIEKEKQKEKRAIAADRKESALQKGS